MLVLSVQNRTVTLQLLDMTAGAAQSLANAMLKDGLSPEAAAVIGKIACAGVIFLGYAVLALLLLHALRQRGAGRARVTACLWPSAFSMRLWQN